MRILVAFVIFIHLNTFFSTAQSLPEQFPSKNKYGKNQVEITQIQGSPYFDSNFKKGTVWMTDGNVHEDIPLRYNCFNDIIEFQNNGISYDVLPRNKIKRAEFGWQKYCYQEIKSVKGFFGILEEGRATLFVRYSLEFYDAAVQAFSEPIPARFDDLYETFYISVNNNPAVKIQNSKKLTEILGDKKQEMQLFLSKQKLSLSNAQHLKKIVNYYNSL